MPGGASECWGGWGHGFLAHFSYLLLLAPPAALPWWCSLLRPPRDGNTTTCTPITFHSPTAPRSALQTAACPRRSCVREGPRGRPRRCTRTGPRCRSPCTGATGGWWWCVANRVVREGGSRGTKRSAGCRSGTGVGAEGQRVRQSPPRGVPGLCASRPAAVGCAGCCAPGLAPLRVLAALLDRRLLVHPAEKVLRVAILRAQPERVLGRHVLQPLPPADVLRAIMRSGAKEKGKAGA